MSAMGPGVESTNVALIAPNPGCRFLDPVKFGMSQTSWSFATLQWSDRTAESLANMAKKRNLEASPLLRAIRHSLKLDEGLFYVRLKSVHG